MNVVPAVFGALLLAAFVAVGRRALDVLTDISRILAGLSQVVGANLEAGEGTVRQELRDLHDLVDRLPIKWEDIKREASRLDARARYAVDRARKELEERGLADERLEDLDRELRLVDGDGSVPRGVHAVSEDVESAPGAIQTEAGDGAWEARLRALKWGA